MKSSSISVNSYLKPYNLSTSIFSVPVLEYEFLFKFLVYQEKIIDELGMEMDSTSNRLEFVQVKKESCHRASTYLLYEISGIT